MLLIFSVVYGFCIAAFQNIDRNSNSLLDILNNIIHFYIQISLIFVYVKQYSPAPKLLTLPKDVHWLGLEVKTV